MQATKAALLIGFVRGSRNQAHADFDGKESAQFIEAYRQSIGEAEPTSELIQLTIPAQFDNGHAVPFTISVDSPMNDTSYIAKIHILSTANPVAKVASFYLSPSNGAAIVSGRFRLAKPQDVYVLAERNDGALFVAKQFVKVTIGGCS